MDTFLPEEVTIVPLAPLVNPSIPFQMCLNTVKWFVKEFQYSQGQFNIPSRSSSYKMGQNLAQNLCGLFWFLFPIQQTDIMVQMRHWLPYVTRPLYCFHSHVI